MSFFQIYLHALMIILVLMSAVWIISVIVKNVSIVDFFWGLGFVITSLFYFLKTDGSQTRKILLIIIVMIWGLRLSVYHCMEK